MPLMRRRKFESSWYDTKVCPFEFSAHKCCPLNISCRHFPLEFKISQILDWSEPYFQEDNITVCLISQHRCCPLNAHTDPSTVDSGANSLLIVLCPLLYPQFYSAYSRHFAKRWMFTISCKSTQKFKNGKKKGTKVQTCLCVWSDSDSLLIVLYSIPYQILLSRPISNIEV